MPYRIDQTKIQAEVAAFPEEMLRYWNAVLEEIAKDPYPRYGYYVDRLIPIRGFPMRTFIFDITEETSISGEQVYVFTGDFFPEYQPMFVVGEERREVVIFYLRENRRF